MFRNKPREARTRVRTTAGSFLVTLTKLKWWFSPNKHILPCKFCDPLAHELGLRDQLPLSLSVIDITKSATHVRNSPPPFSAPRCSADFAPTRTARPCLWDLHWTSIRVSMARANNKLAPTPHNTNQISDQN